MERILEVRAVEIHTLELPFPLPIYACFIAASGFVGDPGYRSPRLVGRAGPRLDAAVLEFDFVADRLQGFFPQIVTPISCVYAGYIPNTVKAVRVYDALGQFVEAAVPPPTRVLPPQAALLGAAPARPVFRRTIARYEDSHHPTGAIVWSNDGPFGVPTAHPEMRKLEHALTLVADGPDQGRINEGVDQSLTAPVMSGLVAGFAGGGLAAISEPGAAFIQNLLSALGQGFAARLEDDARWVHWVA